MSWRGSPPSKHLRRPNQGVRHRESGGAGAYAWPPGTILRVRRADATTQQSQPDVRDASRRKRRRGEPIRASSPRSDDDARLRLAEIDFYEAERRLEKIYSAAVAGDELNVGERTDFGEGEEVDDNVVEILTEVESGKKIESVDLPGRSLNGFREVMQFAAQHPGGIGVPAVGMAFLGYAAPQQLGLGSSEMTWLPVFAGALGATYCPPYITVDSAYNTRPSE